jgi:GT2 family glycosyltransferase
MKVGIILVNYKDYAERFLDECLSSIRNLDVQVKPDLFIVDNASTEKTINYLQDKAPEARLIVNASNDGFAKGNNDALKIMMAENYDYALLLNMDASLSPPALKELLSVAENNLQAGAIQARLMLAGDKERINSLGNVTHFLGFGYCRAYQEKFIDNGRISAPIAYPSGACVLLRIRALTEVGLFDERLWMYNEDQDLGWRLWLRNWECLIAFEAVAYHHYEFSRSISKYYWLERNRLIVAWKNYSLLSLILFFPALVIMEIALLIFSFRSGWFKEKIKSWLYFFNPFNWLYLIKARRLVQKNRKRPDYLILNLFSGTISFQEIDNVLLRYIANPIFNLYFKLMHLIIKSLKK